jgi:hypothetical protein
MGPAQSHQVVIDDLRHVLNDMRRRISHLERQNSDLSKAVINLTVSGNEHKRSIRELHEQALRNRIVEEGRSLSVRQPKAPKVPKASNVSTVPPVPTVPTVPSRPNRPKASSRSLFAK